LRENILKINHLTTSFIVSENTYTAVEDVSFSVQEGEIVGVVGESGCGKSVTFLSCMRLLDERKSTTQGEVLLSGKNLLKISEREMRKVRGRDISMIFQEPMTSLNPLHKIGRQIMEVYKIHRDYSKDEMEKRAIDLLKLVGIGDVEKRFNQYPHELSGGMKQRVMIAMALACEPKVLIADEPTTALDVTIQMQILNLMRDLKNRIQTAIVLVTHDLGVIANMVDRIIVMYAGQIVEVGTTQQIFKDPLHPYTKGLLEAIPNIKHEKERLYAIKGMVPSLANMPKGCRFAKRCEFRVEACDEANPDILRPDGEREVRCIMYKNPNWRPKIDGYGA
jgi:peptide/nickel transport system ATP-binding protein